MFQYKTEQFLQVDINKAWHFFSSPKNLSAITPPELDFRILSELDDQEIYEGMKLDYIVTPLFKIPMHWQTEIIKVKKLHNFTDRQVQGPYRLWEHTHIFKVSGNGVLMTDIINYKLPFGWIGNLAHSLLIRKKIKYIFTYREKILTQIFSDEHILN